MSAHPMMECGHASYSTCEGKPSCVICYPDPRSRKVAETPPDLTGRTATCGGHAPKPSSPDLAFFEYQGPGSKKAAELCKCGYHRVAHEYNANRISKEPIKCKVGGFTPRGPLPFDDYYCGCRGWD